MTSVTIPKASGLLLALMIAGGCSPSPGGEAARSHHGEEPQKVKLERLERRHITRSITLTASLEAYEQVPLYPKVAGYVKTLTVDIGDRVRKGELLVTLEVPEIEQQYVQAKGQVEERRAQLTKEQAESGLARTIYLRSRGLRAKDAITQQDMDEASARYATGKAQVELVRSQELSAQARLREIEAMMSYARLIAPFDGIVTRRFVDPGVLVQAATSNNNVTPVVTVARIDPVRVFVDVPEPDVPLVSRGQPAALAVVALSKRPFKGHVTRFAQALDPVTRTMRTEMDLPNPDGLLRPGMFGNMTIQIEDHGNAMTLPEAAVRSSDGAAHVYVLEGGRAFKHAVRTGLISDGRVETYGLADHAEVIVAQGELPDGARVQTGTEGRDAKAR